MSDADPPTPEQLVRWLLKLLDVKPGDGEARFLGRRKRGGVGRVFGGQVIAQALQAAQRSTDAPKIAHSLHAYFMRPGNEDFPIIFRVSCGLLPCGKSRNGGRASATDGLLDVT